jgi:LmbE family N-acetylglucosaminyl deacetylase
METATAIPSRASAVPRTVLGVWAHPDDEAYLSAGLMVRTTAHGGRVVCIHATRGELGTDEPEQWPPERLGPHRELELAEALAAVGVDEHHLLGLPDGFCDSVDPTEPVRRVTEAISTLRPDVVVTFGPDGITGHPDHIAVSRWATEAWLATGHGSLLYATVTESFLERNRELHRRLRLVPDDAAFVPDDQVALAVALTSSELAAKRRCLAAHASQTDGLAKAMGEHRYRHWYDVESFRRPTPEELRAARGRGRRASPVGGRAR